MSELIVVDVIAMARAIRDHHQHPRDFTPDMPIEELRARLSDAAIKAAHKDFMLRILDPTQVQARNNKELNIRHTLATFYAMTGRMELFPPGNNNACFRAAVDFAQAYGRVLDQVADDNNHVQLPDAELTRLYFGFVDLLPDNENTFLSRCIHASRAILRARAELLPTDDARVVVDRELDRVICAGLRSLTLEPPADATVDERVALLFDTVSENI